MFDQLAQSLPIVRAGRPADVGAPSWSHHGFTTGKVRTVDGGARLV